MENLYNEKPLRCWTFQDVKEAICQTMHHRYLSIIFEDKYTKDACAYLRERNSGLGTCEIVVADAITIDGYTQFLYMPNTDSTLCCDFNEICALVIEYIKKQYQ